MLTVIERAVWRITVFAAAAAGCCPTSGRPGPAGAATATKTPSTAPSTLPSIADLSAPYAINALEAVVDPPVGWRRDKSDVDARHAHFVWLSPSGDTAYGVVLMNLPIPVGPDIVLWAFLNQMRKSDRQADLLRRENAPDLPGLRFVAESGKYRIRANLTVRTWRAWAVYAGTIRARPVNSPELRLAEQARDGTRMTTADTAGRPVNR